MNGLAGNTTRKRSASVDSPFTGVNGDPDPHCNLSREYLKTDPAFNPSHVARPKPSATTTSANVKPRLPRARAAKIASKELATHIIHPRRTIIRHFENKTAKSLSKATRPYITPQADREFLAAHDALFEAEKDEEKPSRRTRNRRGTGKKPSGRGRMTDSEEHTSSETNTEVQRRKVELLEAHRQSILVAWITSRHMKAVRVTPSHIADFPDLADEKFIERKGDGNESNFRWDRYLAQVSIIVHYQHVQVLTFTALTVLFPTVHGTICGRR